MSDSTSLVQIAVYLNLVVSRLFEDKSLAYLSGKKDTPAFKSPKECQDSQETQLLLLGGNQLWIANNDDSASSVQQALLNQLGLNSYTSLSEHVKKYMPNLLPTYGGEGKKKLTATNSSKAPVTKLLFELVDDESKQALSGGKLKLGYDCVIPAQPTTCGSYTVSPTTLPGGENIVFVFGKCTCDKGIEYLHAEQKLLAALGCGLILGKTVTGNVSVFGCKFPCTCCIDVIKGVKPKLVEKSITLDCDAEAKITSMRTNSKLNVCGCDVPKLDLATYFP